MTLSVAMLVLAAATPAAAQATPLAADQQMALTCSAALATTAALQAKGDAAALKHPPLQQRGREFFVRASAKVMEETGLTREQLSGHLTAAATALRDPVRREAAMPGCLAMLDAAGL